MDICIINTYYYPEIIGGAEISVHKLAEGLVKRGHNVSVICTAEEDSQEIINNVKVYRMKVNNVYQPKRVQKNSSSTNRILRKVYNVLDIYNIFNFFKLRKLLSKINPSIIHINNTYGLSNIVWNACSNKERVLVIHTIRDYKIICPNSTLVNKHDEICNNCSKLCEFYRKTNNFLSKNVDIVTGPSNFVTQIVQTNNLYRNAKYYTVYNAIDYDESIFNSLVSKKKDNLYNTKIIKFIYLGRLEKNKGINFLVENFLANKNPNIELYIAGDGQEKENILSMIKDDNRIKYLGFLTPDKIEKLMLDMHVLIIPSLWYEPFGRVVIEAYKNCIPVIGNDIGGISELIENNKTGLLVKCKDNRELEQAINYYSNPQNIIKCIPNFKEKIDMFDLEKQLVEFERIYQTN